MSKTDKILSKGQKLYEDGSYILLWTKFFGLSILALTSYYVYVKKKKSLIKLNGKEKTFLMSITFYLTKEFGVPPKAVIHATTLFKDVANAMADRGGPAWQKFFAVNAKEKAQTYVQQARNFGKKSKY